MSESEVEKRSWARLKVKKERMAVKKKENLGLVVATEEEKDSWYMKIVKKINMIEEGIDCHIRNPKKRFLTTIAGGGGEAVAMAVTCEVWWGFGGFQFQTRVYLKCEECWISHYLYMPLVLVSPLGF